MKKEAYMILSKVHFVTYVTLQHIEFQFVD